MIAQGNLLVAGQESRWVLEYWLKSGTKVRTVPLLEDRADHELEECRKRSEIAWLVPVE